MTAYVHVFRQLQTKTRHIQTFVELCRHVDICRHMSINDVIWDLKPKHIYIYIQIATSIKYMSRVVGEGRQSDDMPSFATYTYICRDTFSFAKTCRDLSIQHKYVEMCRQMPTSVEIYRPLSRYVDKPIYSNICRLISRYGGICPNMSIYAGMSRHVEICRHMSIYADIFRQMPSYTHK